MTYEYPETLAAHDDRCDYPMLGPCTCDEWERFDEDRAEQADSCGCGQSRTMPFCDEECEHDDPD